MNNANGGGKTLNVNPQRTSHKKKRSRVVPRSLPPKPKKIRRKRRLSPCEGEDDAGNLLNQRKRFKERNYGMDDYEDEEKLTKPKPEDEPRDFMGTLTFLECDKLQIGDEIN